MTGSDSPVDTGLSRFGRVVRNIAAPTTLLTALLFFFGWSHAYWFFDYFGVNSTTLGLTTQDYLMRSQDSLFVPLATAACLLTVLLLFRRIFREFVLPRIDASRRSLTIGAAVIGLILVGIGLTSSVVNTVLDRYIALPGLSIVAGTLLIVAALQLRRTNQQIDTSYADSLSAGEWATVFILVGLGLFWAVSDYSAAVGTRRAMEQVEHLAEQPSVSIYSSKSLGLSAPGVVELGCKGADVAYPFRYDGLKLILQSGDQYLLLPAKWSRGNGVAFLLPRSEAIRINFTPVGAAPPPEQCG